MPRSRVGFEVVPIPKYDGLTMTKLLVVFRGDEISIATVEKQDLTELIADLSQASSTEA